MSVPPTLVLTDNEERTTVDRSWRGAPPPVVRDEAPHRDRVGRWRNRLRSGWPTLLAVASTLLLCFVLLAVRNHQRRVDRLLRTIEELHEDRRAGVRSQIATDLGSMDEPLVSLSSAEPRTVEAGTLSREKLELEAATLLIGNDYGGALEIYRSLAIQFPDESVFSALVSILRRRLGCGRQLAVRGSRCD